MAYKDKEKSREYQRQYRVKNREKLLKQMKQYYGDNKAKFAEYRKKYYEDHKEELCQKSSINHVKNRDRNLNRMRSYGEKYYEDNKESLLEKNKQHVKLHRERYTRKQKLYRQKRQDWLWELKCGLCCVKCGESHPACLDFHHTDPKNKDGLISKLIARASMDRVIAEIEKCETLCANCHRKFHCKRKINKG